jgi:AGCS family alanine or glycine:cation symporter
VILCSGVEIHYGTDPGITLTLDAFARIYGNWIRIILTLLTCIFAFATILGWGIYGARCAQFLFGDKVWKYFTKFQSIGVILGVLLQTSSVWALAEIVNGLMALPNLIALLFLSPEFYRILSNYHKENAHSF